jgi:hypothetical protein
MPINTEVVSSNLAQARCTRYNIFHFIIKAWSRRENWNYKIRPNIMWLQKYDPSSWKNEMQNNFAVLHVPITWFNISQNITSFLQIITHINQCLSTLKLWVPILLRRGALDTTLCDKVCQWLAKGCWFSPVSSTNKNWLRNINYTSIHPSTYIFKGDNTESCNQNRKGEIIKKKERKDIICLLWKGDMGFKATFNNISIISRQSVFIGGGNWPMQSMPINTEVVSSNLAQARCTRYNIMW